ncbi:hypothetical protein FOQG_17136 [Fusarium oxysporum f. sp. raphani 54005]|uniref:Uncharacterized protein n=4 Tax=Fusarium oxysporum TaxID=5507 RepID=A0A0J9VXC9_FUSO4|nr:hypothetical protein FOXG_21005 [Fusarium oxysporum f. sp. lycopersici 4287]XP_018252138.1 hypothetical protein FOXG_21044 [Fusarium oxysporum f. sp. lycopersici 4287]XP_018253461.1 hypothetical protein FOXG_21312 [Fusarium oxysporum f. sp. lycopersici 4287]XP_018257925.1 hypothetical protein FOXG_22663 [Fusarium oxysporum f. sp. lycopersici 4287]EXK26287.1 hypothetical protein FOMG_17094 [Fusarium oxysporum f. sp. melonis 26406]EXK78186.1 hypothetical protein FOQG_17136 [Fusarium oxysporum
MSASSKWTSRLSNYIDLDPMSVRSAPTAKA